MATHDANPYLSTAFYSQYNLILLGGSALFSLASASVWPLAAGVGCELLWLGLGARLPSFKRRVDARREGERRARVEDELQRGLSGLNAEHAARFSSVSQAISWIGIQSRSPSDPVERAALQELETLRPAFLRLCVLREKLMARAEEFAQSPPDQEEAALSRAYAAEKDLGQRFTLHQGIKRAQKKREQQVRFADVLHQVEHKQLLVEQSLVRLSQQREQGLRGVELANETQAILTHVLLLPALEQELDA